MNSAGKKIKKSVVLEMIAQNQAMRKLLEEWPAREIKMDYEKEWNDRREDLLNKYQDLHIEVS